MVGEEGGLVGGGWRRAIGNLSCWLKPHILETGVMMCLWETNLFTTTVSYYLHMADFVNGDQCPPPPLSQPGALIYS